jgi:hypothetical protein
LEPEPWRELPPALAELMAPELPSLRDEILAVIAEEVPDYARPLEGNFGLGIRLGVDEALAQFVRLVADPDGGRDQSSVVYRGLGRGEMREGRSLDALQAAYRVGARVAWRRLSATGRAAGLDPDTLCSLADAIFAYIDELSADSVEGYAQAQQAAAGERERRRRRVLAVLLADVVSVDALREAAALATWEPPTQLAVLACDPADLDAIARRLPVGVLAGVIDEVGCVVIGDASGPGRRKELGRACDGRAAALGPERALVQARESWLRARRGFSAIRAGALPSELCVVDEHLSALALFDAREPLKDLATQRLQPLEPLTAAARTRMRETLRAYLDHRGNAAAMAEALHVHPQTARYRLRRLRDLFGDALDSADARFEFDAALRAGT